MQCQHKTSVRLWVKLPFTRLSSTGMVNVTLCNCQNPNATPMQPQRNRWVCFENNFANHATTTTHSMFLGTSWTDSNCHGDICPGNICPRDICPYQEYLSSNWPDFDETLKIGSWEHLEQIPTVMVTFVQATFGLATFVHIRNSSAVTVDQTFGTEFFGGLNFCGPIFLLDKLLLTQKIFGTKIFLYPIS